MTKKTKSIIPIYTTLGDVEALLVYPHIYNLTGEWIGWVTSELEVYSVIGSYVGYLSNDPRILRERVLDHPKPQRNPPAAPQPVYPPATVPLAPMMPLLGFDTVDVLLEEPYRLHTIDSDEFRDDMAK